MHSSNTLLLGTEAVGTPSPPALSAGDEHELEENFLDDHWNCFDGPSCFATYPAPRKDHVSPEDDGKRDVPPLRPGEVYSLLDFCCHRVLAWYRSEVNRLLHLAEAENTPVAGETPCRNRKLMDTWTSSHEKHLEQLNTPTEARAATPSLIVTFTTRTALPSHKTPIRVQPSRKSKRKAAEMDDTKPRVTVKRRKISTARPSLSGGTYHMSQTAFSHALHLFVPPAEEIHGKICHRNYRSFRNRLIARVTSKMMGIYSRKATEKNKPRRCVLQGRETAGPWCASGRQTAGTFAEEVEEAARLSTAPEPDMLASPSCANWPPPPKSRTRMAKEDGEQNVVEFEGLKFLVDVCGEPPVPRVMMM
ncbi:hypothetical protein CONLIGDRAFT_648790 [Coniochaeta ligniaria NRRL 30616]|uniref:Uncharacterized protein n=1 Tax=Coniochaeta ligniaria NRRL 30616 TaxID=1408157 RepID=A0A1J7IAF2_9PEZI|nr:hypothetical protein CONLIGDRAFT_648790 [Coniochaeta ligniaria NRRL 30616]